MYPYDRDIKGDHTKRFSRPWLFWGQDDDPGLELVTATSEDTLCSVLPEQVQPGVMNLDVSAQQIFLPPSDTMVRIRHPPSDMRSIGVKITTFACGGVAIGVGINHTLADAQSLSLFVADWSTVHRALLAGDHPTTSLPERRFDPLLLDQHAAGDIDGDQEDERLADVALELPQIRLDWWASSQGKPDMIRTPTEPDILVRHLDSSSRGARIPWETWEHSSPVADYTLEFSTEKIQAIWESAGSESRAQDKLSRLDTLQAYLWRHIVKARQLPSETMTYMDISLGLRTRLDPPLPSTFLGSPILNYSASATVSSLAESSLFETARLIRSNLLKFSPSTISALLHHLAHAVDPNRNWNAFMGDHHLLTTSWIGFGGYENVDFGSGGPELVVAGMWPIDGLIVLMERPQTALRRYLATPPLKWYDYGVSVRLFLKTSVMERLLVEPDLL